LPILEALMSKGRVSRGDTIILPVPKPDAWDATVEYVYTGKMECPDEIRHNIEFLGGEFA
jgi:hypothetical protein